jgi:hypothetical protein
MSSKQCYGTNIPWAMYDIQFGNSGSNQIFKIEFSSFLMMKH